MDNFPIDPQQIIFIVIIVISGISQLIGKFNKGLNKGKPQHTPDHTPSEHDPLSEFKRMIEEARKESQPSPPPPASPKVSPPPPSRTELPPAPITFTTKAPEAAPPSTKGMTRRKSGNKKPSSSNAATPSLTALLSSPESARQAIILTEVLGKPKGLS